MRIPWVRDEIILAADLRNSAGRHLSMSDLQVIELSNLLRRAKFHAIAKRDPSFRSPGSVRRKMADVGTSDPKYTGRATKGNSLDAGVREDFEADPDAMHALALLIRRLIEEGLEPLDADDLDNFEAEEGRLVTVLVRRRERDRRLRATKIDGVLSEGRELDCEVCNVNFEAKYGPRGRGYVEIHHVLPLSVSGPTLTSLEDLALLCSNCHRMVHQTPWITPVDLRQQMLEALRA